MGPIWTYDDWDRRCFRIRGVSATEGDDLPEIWGDNLSKTDGDNSEIRGRLNPVVVGGRTTVTSSTTAGSDGVSLVNDRGALSFRCTLLCCFCCCFWDNDVDRSVLSKLSGNERRRSLTVLFPLNSVALPLVHPTIKSISSSSNDDVVSLVEERREVSRLSSHNLQCSTSNSL